MDMRSVLEKLASSRKVWVCLAAVTAAAVLAGLGKISGEAFLDFTKWLAITVIGATGLEDAAHKFGLPPGSSK